MMPQPTDKKPGALSRLLTTIHPPARAYFYKPASIWMLPAFLSAFVLIIINIFGPVQLATNYGPAAGVAALFPWGAVGIVIGVFMISYSTIAFLVATGYFVVMGDGGIMHVENLEAVNYGPISTSIEMRHKKLKVNGKEVKVWKYGRLGGVRGVVAGGGSDGYVAICCYRWFENPVGDVIDGYKPTEPEMHDLERNYPGIVWSNVLIIPLQAWKCYSKQLPLALRLKIEHDWKWNERSPVWVLYDPLDWKVLKRQDQVPGAVVELWGYTQAYNELVFSHNELAKSYAKLSSTYTMSEAQQ